MTVLLGCAEGTQGPAKENRVYVVHQCCLTGVPSPSRSDGFGATGYLKLLKDRAEMVVLATDVIHCYLNPHETSAVSVAQSGHREQA